MIHRYSTSLSLLVLAFALFACVSKKDEVPVLVKEPVFEYPNVVLDSIIVTSLQETTPLHPISDIVLGEFFNIAHKYPGTKPTMTIPLKDYQKGENFF